MSVSRTAAKTKLPDGASPALKQLAALVGEWEIELLFPTNPPGRGLGRATFEWVDEGAYLAYRIGNRRTGPPYSLCIIGRDESVKNYTMLYFDDRGVSRVYQMSLEHGEWKQWREAPGFSQRFIGHLSEDGNTITARWEKSQDGKQWEHDFKITYRRVT